MQTVLISIGTTSLEAKEGELVALRAVAQGAEDIALEMLPEGFVEL
jgi:hypothetical protein